MLFCLLVQFMLVLDVRCSPGCRGRGGKQKEGRHALPTCCWSPLRPHEPRKHICHSAKRLNVSQSTPHASDSLHLCLNFPLLTLTRHLPHPTCSFVLSPPRFPPDRSDNQTDFEGVLHRVIDWLLPHTVSHRRDFQPHNGAAVLSNSARPEPLARGGSTDSPSCFYSRYSECTLAQKHTCTTRTRYLYVVLCPILTTASRLTSHSHLSCPLTTSFG